MSDSLVGLLSLRIKLNISCLYLINLGDSKNSCKKEVLEENCTDFKDLFGHLWYYTICVSIFLLLSKCRPTQVSK